MKKAYVIRNTENNKYFTGRWDCWWSLDIEDAAAYQKINLVERAIEEQINPDNSLGAFENVKSVIIETIYIIK